MGNIFLKSQTEPEPFPPAVPSQTPYAEYPAHWYFCENSEGKRVPVTYELQLKLEESDKTPPIEIPEHMRHLFHDINPENRMFVKHPWKN